MIRKLLFLASFLLTVAATSAQTVGEWNIFSRFTGNVDNLLETKDKVYYTSGQRLFSYDKDTNESYSYSTRNKLNDTNITYVQYNPDNRYLFIAYDNGNIDLLYDNGKVVNLSDIKDATLPYAKTINSAIFADNRIYLGTAFGMVIYDDQKHEVVESGIYGLPIQSVFPMDEYLFLHRYSGNTDLYYAPLNGHHNTFDKFTFYTGFRSPWVQPFGDKYMAYVNANNGNKLDVYTFSFKDGKPGWGNDEIFDEIIPNQAPVMTSNGCYITTTNAIIYLDETGHPERTISLPAPVAGQKVATYAGAKSVWAANAEGIGSYNIENGSTTVLVDKFKPEGIATDMVFITQPDNHGAIWLGNIGVSKYKNGWNGDWYWVGQATTRIKNGHPEEMTAYNVTLHNSSSIREQNAAKTTIMMGACSGFDVDPEYPNRYYQGNDLEGLFVIEDNKVLHNFYSVNSPFAKDWNIRVMDVKFDHEGNLWVGALTTSINDAPVYVLPKATLRNKKYEDITSNDWLTTKHQGAILGDKDLSMLICKKSPVVITTAGTYAGSIGVLKTNNTLTNMDDDKFFQLIKPYDQDGKVWSPTRITCAVEDHKGRVWVGCESAGIIEITNPGSLEESSRVSRIKVPRNDGTNYADYLCETDLVYAIAVDNSNRKWIATESSGVYLVSENGDEILEHFTTDNSPLPSNQVLSVACDPNSNTVYFGLYTGLLSYNSNSSPAAEDFSQVYAYPNPVRPDYNGPVTIAGLMENALVKIADAAGNIVYQTRAEGGMAVWNGLDSSNNRVKSGVYFVFASENADGGSSGAVTKILVIR